MCKECSSFQCNWKNNLKYFAGIIGFFVIISSFGIYSYEKIINIFFKNTEIKVINFVDIKDKYEKNKLIVLANVGSENLFISHFKYGSKGIKYNFGKSIGIYEKIDSNDVIKIQNNNKETKNIPEYETYMPIKESTWNKLKDIDIQKDECLRWQVYLNDGHGHTL
ncbi:MAG: hypothetical protein ACR2NC_03525, partial [Thermodesulfobacteriota bacterium]